MSDFLQAVVEEQRARVAELRRRRDDLRRRSERRSRAPRDLAAALRGRSAGRMLAVVAEVKRRSPSAGELGRIPDAAALALHYALGGAAAISVLTEDRHFGGSLEDLGRVAESVRVPVLRKDFVVDELQVLEAHAYGADAVLLIADALAADTLGRLLARAAELGLGAVVEAHAEDALERAIESGAAVVGINQRDLRTLALDGGRAARLAGAVPADRVLVAESGIESAAEARALPARVDAVLVGSALVRSARPHELVAELAAVRRAAAS